MLATFVIGLREGLEAALIVGIVAAFLKQRGSARAMRSVWIGVLSALVICLTVGIILQVVSANLPQRQQEGLETVIGAVAVGMVTYMVVWMRRHSRDLKGQLEASATSALATGSARALIAMAFLAVLREGLETAVFLLAAFNASGNGFTAGIGALLGILVAVALGYGIYRGGVRINLSRFFRGTGIVLVIVAAGLVMTALHTAHEANWLNAGQDRLFDISWLVRNGSVQGSLITGVLGFQPQPTEIEIIGYLLYLIPVGIYVAWPPGKRVPWRPLAWVSAAVSIGCAAAAVGFAVAAPSKPAAQTGWTSAVTGTSTTQVGASGFSAARKVAADGTITWTAEGAKVSGTGQVSGEAVQTLTRVTTGKVAAQLPTSVTLDQLRQLNGGRLPIGLRASDVTGDIPIAYAQEVTDTLSRDPDTGRLLDAARHTVVRATATLSTGPLVLGAVTDTTQQPTKAALAAAASDNASAAKTLSRADSWGSDYPTIFGIAAAAFAVFTVGAARAGRRRKGAGAAVDSPAVAVGSASEASTEPAARVAKEPASSTSARLPVR